MMEPSVDTDGDRMSGWWAGAAFVRCSCANIIVS
jgi:hypothetical protein